MRGTAAGAMIRSDEFAGRPAWAAKVDPRAALADLGLPAPVACSPVGGGAWAALWRVVDTEGTWALRVLPTGADAAARREVAVMAVARAGGVPVPVLRATGTFGDHPVLVTAWVPGHTVADALARRPWRAWALGHACGDVLATIHQVSAPPSLRANPGDSWLEMVAAGPLGRDIQARLAGCDRNSVLIHLDFHPANVLTDGRRVTGVVDWTNAGAGDWRADVARTWSILRLDVGRPGVLTPLGRLVLAVFTAGWWAGYRQAARRANVPAVPRRLAGLALFHAWAGSYMVRDLAGRRDAAFWQRADGWIGHWLARADSPSARPGVPPSGH